MFTVCPKCALTLVVTAGDLRVAQGYVRCGRCSNVFNAISALSDERQAQPEGGHAEPSEAAPPPAGERSRPGTPAAPGPAGEPDGAAETEPPASALEFDPAATNVSDVFVEPQIGDTDATGTFEAIVLEGGPAEDATPEPAAKHDPDDELKQQLQSLAAQIDAERQRPPPARDAAGASTSGGLSSRNGAEDDAEDTSSRTVWTWRAGIVAASLLLLAQVLHHYRNTLAVYPQLGNALASIYGAIGVSLEPRWDVAAYEVRQLGASSDPRNDAHLIVRASVKNNAQRSQPLPLLRVTVQDRYGNAIATSDVAPAAYMPASASRESTLGAGQRLDVELRFVDPGSDAVGFEIDACLAAPGGGVNCANR
jgi:predicted Zn finger-like uncharacterized protein